MFRSIRSLSFALLCLLSLAASMPVRAAEEPELPGDLDAGRLLYRASMTDADSVKDWRMEGPGDLSFKDGWMHMRSPGEKMHHVFWCPKRFPESFIARWEAQNLETDAGLCIVFFAAAGRDGGSIFADDLPERDGNFRQYTRGAIRCYHTSYYANAAHNPDRRQTNLRKNPGFHLVQEGAEGIPTESEKVHTITLAKDGNHIRLWVDDRKVIDWTDEGRKGGDPHRDGFIGLRQMKWTHFRCRNFRVWEVSDDRSRGGAAAGTNGIKDLIRRAGNAESEKKRYDILSELKQREDLPAKLRRDLRRLLPVIDWWANGREKAVRGTGGRAAENGYLCRFFYPQAMLRRGANYPPKVREESPLYPIWAFYKARSLLWIPIQIGGIRRDKNKREQYYSKARRYLDVAGKAFPENRIIAMYNGDPYPWPADFQPDPNAPRWANLQREGLEKLTEVIHWWIENRQIEDGQYGGGWGDDVEMWRWWTPILVAFRDPKIIRAQSKLSNSILSEPHLRHGYTSHLSDVEHTAEDTGDSITPMIFLQPDNREWRRRALRIIELADQVWMAENRRGFLQFKSTWFNHEKVDTTPRRACDTVYHPRTFHPALIHWLRSGDETVGDLITRWMDTWVDATARAENGKPAGITPSAIHWPDGEVGGGVEPWWKPRNYRNDLYSWPSAMSLMTRTMLLTYHMTGDEKYLEPIRSMARIRRKYLNNPPEGEPEPGSAAWCALEGSPRFAGNGMARFLPSTLAKYRLLTGDSTFDELLKEDAGGYMKMRLGEGKEALEADLEQNARAFRINRPAYTSEMRWTDRVLTFNYRWGNEGNGWDWPTPNTSSLYAGVTGDPGDPRYFPLNAVRWLTEPRAFAALVTESGQKRFTARLYHFGNEPRDLEAALYLLEEGRYQLTLADADGRELESRTLEVSGERTRISVDLPPRTLCTLRVEPLR